MESQQTSFEPKHNQAYGQELKCTQHPQNSTRTVRAADDFVIQGHTEQVIDAFVQRCEGDDFG